MSAERLLELLNRYDLKWGLLDNGYLVALYNPETINEYMNRVFPIKLWFSVATLNFLETFNSDVRNETLKLEDHLWISPENINKVLDSFENEYFESEEHAATYTEVWTIVEIFKDVLENVEVNEDEMILTIEDSMDQVEEIKTNDLPPQLTKLIETKDSSLIIPLQYVPLIADSHTQIFPLYYPSKEQMLYKLIDFLRNVEPGLQRHVFRDDTITFSVRNDINKAYENLVGIFGAENVVRIENGITIYNVFQLYRNLWNEHIDALLESKYRHQLLLDRVGSADLIPLVEDYLIAENPTYERVFGLPLRRREGLTRELRARLGSDLAGLIGQYEPSLLPPPSIQQHRLG